MKEPTTKREWRLWDTPFPPVLECNGVGVSVDEKLAEYLNALEACADALEKAQWGTEGLCGVCEAVNSHEHEADCPVGLSLARLRELRS